MTWIVRKYIAYLVFDSQEGENSETYAFEPNPKSFSLISKTIKMNQLKNVIPLNLGLGDKEDTLRFIPRGSSSCFLKNGKLKIKVIPIDNFVQENNLDVGLIKLDVEGFGFEVIKGAKKTIKISQPILLISIYHNGKEFFEIIKYIKKINPSYNIIIRKLNPYAITDETSIIAWVIN